MMVIVLTLYGVWYGTIPYRNTVPGTIQHIQHRQQYLSFNLSSHGLSSLVCLYLYCQDRYDTRPLFLKTT